MKHSTEIIITALFTAIAPSTVASSAQAGHAKPVGNAAVGLAQINACCFGLFDQPFSGLIDQSGIGGKSNILFANRGIDDYPCKVRGLPIVISTDILTSAGYVQIFYDYDDHLE